ncbi:MAG: tail fiber domain-containing protein [Flavobacteriales bacterium]|nr:tail fiber domain-containing protein [Flavobacteriales bacterium]MBP9081154.1 tail fiber domain-containing protein [Flavobacteriales bacterium]
MSTINNQPIHFTTSNLLRAQINERVTYPTLGAFTNVIADGYTLLTGEPDAITNVNSRAPFSRLHLVDDAGTMAPNVYAQEYGFRNWMRNGITFSGNSDQAYIGQRYAGDDNTDFVIQWSDNINGSPWGTDRMKFVFCGGYNSSSHTGQSSIQGLEAMRLWPQDGDNVNVGIGDFSVPNTDPTERLHVLTGRARIQQLPDNPEASTLTKVLVVDDSPTPSGERGVLKWRNINNLAGCDWQVQANNDVASVYNGSGCPWNYDNFVGIGMQNPKAKLQVEYSAEGANFTGDVTVSTLWSNTIGGRALMGYARTASAAHFINANFTGVSGVATNAKFSYGVQGLAINVSNSPAADIIGVFGNAVCTANAGRAVGLLGKASGAGNGTWAVWSEGAQFSTTGSAWTTSDATLKTQIEAYDGGLDLIMQLQPKRYQYATGEFPWLNLPTGPQVGLIAQDMEAVLPELVRDVHRPAEVDSLGNEVVAAMDFKAVKYDALIPLLVSAVQEQQATIAHMQQQLAACCAAQDQGMAPQDGTTPKQSSQAGELKEQRLRIIPNPLAELTTLEYVVPTAGRVSLVVSSIDGKPLGTLREEQAEAGAYSYTWNTGLLAAGTYLCTYLFNGAVVVQRAVKVR